MKNWLKALLYTGLLVTANLGAAGDIAGLREGDMKKLAVHAEPHDFPDVAFDAPEGEASLAEYRGRIVVLNFWALWCAPCREEMPTLEALQHRFGAEDFAVVTLATGPNAPPAIDRFLDEIGVTALPRYRDPRSRLARAAGVLGLPVTVILDREGREIARLVGTADWSSDSAIRIVESLLARESQG
ncbi:Thioredoxin, thioldisulfide interchange protein [Pseudooceanicola batsensis HTCC2597]|uniref:Thioredoxin, thioldisulfide interchange protein n=1 Tax=Pseudooceanicola batsensis (strain ATCC BAA-863 / DSM 15984 / KCTC 12145 / HTCC2597) TaxID=252305 RepID=A3TV65_PSEBH|nr:TlpA disulfide reductase family protein [Pseudooceanicola batsensis]EAQ04411.1 Thioredoxin, thioldisulfide interchange protein [Pseudooceanicola batsensis HTCC2597]